MRPTRPPSGKVDLFRERLEAIIDPHHALVRLAGLVPWSRFDEAFGRFYRPIGRPAKPTRLINNQATDSCTFESRLHASGVLGAALPHAKSHAWFFGTVRLMLK